MWPPIPLTEWQLEQPRSPLPNAVFPARTIAGVGAAGHLAGISFQKETGTRFQFVPYRGNAPAMQDLLAGNIDFMMEPSSNFGWP